MALISFIQQITDIPGSGRIPIFTTGIGSETTANSAPFLLSLAEFHDLYSFNAPRRRLLNELSMLIADGRRHGVDFEVALFGGSFLQLDRPDPSDIDALLLYSISDGADAEAAIEWLHSTRAGPCHAHFCPADAGLAVMVKRLAFFVYLFGYDKQTGTVCRGTVMIALKSGART